jgi:DNA polymerase-1
MLEIKERLSCATYSGYLTGKGNFRHKVATVKPYKGNRKSEKPYHYQAIRDYLVENHGAVIVDGMEADDAVSIEATQNPQAIIVSRDKDLRQVPVRVYSYPLGNSPEKFEHGNPLGSAAYAFNNFLRQVVTGDTTDNYPGLPRKGESFYGKLVIEFARDLFNRVQFAYIEHYGEQGIERFLEQARLAWMVRELDNEGNPVLPTPEFDFYAKYYFSNNQ